MTRGLTPAFRTARRGLITAAVAVAVAAVAGLVRAVDRLELLQAPAGTDGDAGERALGQVDRHLRLVAQALVEAVEQRTAAGEHDAAVHDVGRELGRRL